NIHLKGAVSAPEIDGRLNFSNASALVVPAQTRYSISTGELLMTSDKIIPDMTFLDEEGREARLEGKIDHHNFSNIIFDMRFHTEGFTFLNSEQRNDDLYFGKFVGKVNASISGDLKLPEIKASLTTLDESDMTVQLLSKQAIMRQEEYMMFYNGKINYTLSQLDSIAKERYNIHSGVDLTLNVSIRDDSQFRLVIDPLTGDNLEIKGNADLVVRIPKSGNLSITGIFTVEEGNYRFSYQSMLKRDFGIEKGSSIRFTGNLMEALLNIRAVYATQASTYALLQSEIGSMSDSEIRSLRRKSDVSVLLNIAGKLSSPELSFDIRLDDDAQGSYSSSVDRILNRLREDESELNKQVFSLMLFNSFTGVSSSGNATTATSGTAIRSVGNMINSQLNRLTNNAEGLVIDFDLDQYSNVTNDSESDLTEIELGISKSLFQDKLTISVGSSITLEGGNAEGGALSDVAGDFVLEYKITEGGKYRVKVFQTADYDNLVNDNIWKTGVGFSYQTRFGSRRIKKQKDYGAD
ncbi:MAG: translocation/assembly module TamB, partial [Bacteroidetes bacterium]|nr:translocation/assembly module TamB [Bacteroidota bacterium]